MERADLDELTARMGAVELLARVLLAREIHADPMFAAVMEDLSSDIDEETDQRQDPDPSHRNLMFHAMVQESVREARRIADGWSEADARKLRQPHP